MAKLLVMYAKATDPDKFDKQYAESHIPLVHKIPGLQKFEITTGPVMSPFGESTFHRLATLHFATMDDLKAGMASPEGRAAGADAETLPVLGMQILMYEDREV